MHILQLGGGFIGDKVADNLRKKGHTVDLMDLRTTGHDITNREQMQTVISANKYDTVILMAAIANLNDFEKNPLLGMDVNINGLINVANACMLTHTKLAYISTCCVYGNTPELPSTEESVVSPSEIYAAAKYAGEWIIKGYHKSYNLDYVILRIATTYGPSMRAALAPAVFINQAMRGEPITIHGSGNQTRTLTYIDDEVEGIATVIESGVKNEIFNISTEEERSVNELAAIVKEELALPDVSIVHVPDRVGQTFTEQIDAGKVRDIRIWKGRYCPDPSKCERVTGWEAKVSLREGIRRTIAWMKENNIKEFI
jgi:nucleoside-diphosphate-sugar epimerase